MFDPKRTCLSCGHRGLDLDYDEAQDEDGEWYWHHWSECPHCGSQADVNCWHYPLDITRPN